MRQNGLGCAWGRWSGCGGVLKGNKEENMKFTMVYWQDDGWYVGKIKEVPGVFSQGETLEELTVNIQDAYQLIMEDDTAVPPGQVQTTEIRLSVA